MAKRNSQHSFLVHDREVMSEKYFMCKCFNIILYTNNDTNDFKNAINVTITYEALKGVRKEFKKDIIYCLNCGTDVYTQEYGDDDENSYFILPHESVAKDSFHLVTRETTAGYSPFLDIVLFQPLDSTKDNKDKKIDAYTKERLNTYRNMCEHELDIKVKQYIEEQTRCMYEKLNRADDDARRYCILIDKFRPETQPLMKSTPVEKEQLVFNREVKLVEKEQQVVEAISEDSVDSKLTTLPLVIEEKESEGRFKEGRPQF